MLNNNDAVSDISCDVTKTRKTQISIYPCTKKGRKKHYLKDKIELVMKISWF